MQSVRAVVRTVIAHHVHREVATIRASHHLERDLGLTPLRVILVALDVEAIEDIHVPIEELAGVATVAELSWFFARCVAYARRTSGERERQLS